MRPTLKKKLITGLLLVQLVNVTCVQVEIKMVPTENKQEKAAQLVMFTTVVFLAIKMPIEKVLYQS